MSRYLAEAIGTFLLVFLGTFIITQAGGSVGMIAVGFGITLFLVVMLFGSVSGAHVNPAVTFGAWFHGSLSTHDVVPYWVAQAIGACLASALVAGIVGFGSTIGETTYGVLGWRNAFLLEAVFTCVFVYIILKVKNRKRTQAALAIAGTLTLVHLIGVPLTGTSVNPIRSIAPVVVHADPLAAAELWVYILGPLLGGMLAGLLAKYVRFASA